MPSNAEQAASLIAEAQNNWLTAQRHIDTILAGKSTGLTCTGCNSSGEWEKYQDSMHAWATKIRETQFVGVSAYVKAEAGASFIAGAKIGVEVKDNKIKIYFVPSYGQAGASATITGGVSVTNDIEGEMGSWTASEGGAFGALLIGEATLKHDDKYVEFSYGGGAGGAAEVYFLPVSVEKEYAQSWELPFNLGKNGRLLPAYEGAPSAQEWINMLNGDGW